MSARGSIHIVAGLLMAMTMLTCATMNAKMERFRAQNRTNMFRVSRGMPRDSVLTIMGIKTVEISNKWEVGIANTQRHQTYVLTNPYRTETLPGPRDTLEVLFYYTDVKSRDSAITDDELTPFVFKDGRLLGWGYSLLNESVQKYEIRIR